MNKLKFLFPIVFLTFSILSACAPTVYEYPTKIPEPVYNRKENPAEDPDESTPSPDRQIYQSRGPYGTLEGDSSTAPDKHSTSPPRIGSDVSPNSESANDYLLAAVSSLENQSEQLLAQGKTDQAFATAERAIRMDPSNAKIWNLLARIQLERGNYSQAEQLSRKSNLLAKNHKGLQAENWRIIAKALRGKGLEDEAERALQKAMELERN